jgi:hypothetical protein
MSAGKSGTGNSLTCALGPALTSTLTGVAECR